MDARILLPYWIYRVHSAVPDWRGWRMKGWAWSNRRCEECERRDGFVRIDTPIGRGSNFFARRQW